MQRGRLILGALLVLSPFLFNTTLAANIGLGSSQIEFGQGIQVLTACSGSTPLTLTPVASFANEAAGGAFKFSGYTVSNIPTSCNGVTLTVSAYNSDSQTSLAIFNSNSSQSSVRKNSSDFSLVRGTGSTLTTLSASSYSVTFTTPVALTSAVSKLTLQSEVVETAPEYESIQFTNAGSSISFTPGLSPGTQPFTIEFWFKTDSVFNGGSILGNSNTHGGLSFILDSASNAHIDGYGIAAYQYALPNLQANTWYHIAISRDSSNNETVWVNGVRSSTGIQTDNINYAGTATFINTAHCTWCVSGSSTFDGERLANLRVVIGSAVYDPTQSSISVPTMPLANISNTKLLMLFGHGALMADASGNQVATNNGTTYMAGQ